MKPFRSILRLKKAEFPTLCQGGASRGLDFTPERFPFERVRIHERRRVVQGKKYSNFPLFLSLLPPRAPSSSVISAEIGLYNFPNTQIKRSVKNGAVTDDTVKINWRLDSRSCFGFKLSGFRWWCLDGFPNRGVFLQHHSGPKEIIFCSDFRSKIGGKLIKLFC